MQGEESDYSDGQDSVPAKEAEENLGKGLRDTIRGVGKWLLITEFFFSPE